MEISLLTDGPIVALRAKESVHEDDGTVVSIFRAAFGRRMEVVRQSQVLRVTSAAEASFAGE